eukprot:NODE_2118_length_1202_cov_7.432784_g1756_i0.p1 GENE.NODE_2118_length_1202_cov_7.432784_g1756_i0~~NODE_2118_length_1202_cov_7.432784_g1756_i0.p1  ORF type:complete len:382 (+),score=63.24 NODE_2118_length_1202_cov_7.432784_g1756_i0:27-1148(+)
MLCAALGPQEALAKSQTAGDNEAARLRAARDAAKERHHEAHTVQLELSGEVSPPGSPRPQSPREDQDGVSVPSMPKRFAVAKDMMAVDAELPARLRMMKKMMAARQDKASKDKDYLLGDFLLPSVQVPQPGAQVASSPQATPSVPATSQSASFGHSFPSRAISRPSPSRPSTVVNKLRGTDNKKAPPGGLAVGSLKLFNRDPSYLAGLGEDEDDPRRPSEITAAQAPLVSASPASQVNARARTAEINEVRSHHIAEEAARSSPRRPESPTTHAAEIAAPPPPSGYSTSTFSVPAAPANHVGLPSVLTKKKMGHIPPGKEKPSNPPSGVRGPQGGSVPGKMKPATGVKQKDPAAREAGVVWGLIFAEEKARLES